MAKTKTSFKPGKSGNLGGRPKASYDVQELARSYTLDAINKLVEHMNGDNAQVSLRACEILLERGYGKPIQPQHVSGTMDMTLTEKMDAVFKRFATIENLVRGLRRYEADYNTYTGKGGRIRFFLVPIDIGEGLAGQSGGASI
jgi:hypothetical protein